MANFLTTTESCTGSVGKEVKADLLCNTWLFFSADRLDVVFHLVIRDLEHRQRTAPWNDWVENVVHGGKIRVLSARLLWTTSFPCKQRKCKWSKCSKRLFTVFPKRSVALCLCSPRAAPSSFSLFFTSELFFVGQLLLSIKSSRAWSSSVFQGHFPLGVFSLYTW